MRQEAVSGISPRHLKAFLAVIETGQLTRASAAIQRSPSSISRSVDILEKTFGVALIERNDMSFAASDCGKMVAARARDIESELAACRDLLARFEPEQVRSNASLFQMRFDITHLTAVVNVANLKSVQRAAHAMAVSQPAVSYSIRLLEADLGVKLFSRMPNGMIATPAGTTLSLFARRIISELARMHDDVASMQGPSSGLVCAGGLAYSRSALLPDAINRTLLEHPGIIVRTVEGPIDTLLAALHGGEIDVIICAYPDRALLDGIETQPIASDPMGFFVSTSHPLATRRGLSLNELTSYPFVMPPKGSITRKLLEDYFADGGAGRIQGRAETSSYSIIRNLLLESDHIAFRSLREFGTQRMEKQIVALDMEPQMPVRTICLLLRRGVRPTAAVKDFLAIVRSVADSG